MASSNQAGSWLALVVLFLSLTSAPANADEYLIAADEPVAEPAEPPPIKIPPLPDPNTDPGASDEVPVPDPDRGKIKVGPTVIDQYPANPRCYVGGRYVPSPPLCPN